MTRARDDVDDAGGSDDAVCYCCRLGSSNTIRVVEPTTAPVAATAHDRLTTEFLLYTLSPLRVVVTTWCQSSSAVLVPVPVGLITYSPSRMSARSHPSAAAAASRHDRREIGGIYEEEDLDESASVPKDGVHLERLPADSSSSARPPVATESSLLRRGMSPTDVAAVAEAHRDRMVADIRSRRPARPFDQLHSSDRSFYSKRMNCGLRSYRSGVNRVRSESKSSHLHGVVMISLPSSFTSD